MLPDCASEIVDHAKKEFPRESCGLIIIKRGKMIYWPCKNLAIKQAQFIMDPKDFASAEDFGEIMAIVHSHCSEPATPSAADRVSCEASRLPWFIVSIPNETWSYIEPTGFKAPLIGRKFAHGVLDCYSLVRDWFREERGVELPDFDRDELWWRHGDNLYMENFHKAGFRKLEDHETVLPGDCFLMQIGSKVANHAAIYLGDNLILHHLINRLSCRDVYGGYYKKVTRCTVRYEGIK